MKQLPELDQRLAQMERIFHAPSLTPELIAAIKLISPHCDLAPRERHRLVWEADQNGACWGEYEALEPFLSRIPTDAKILEIGPGMGRSLVFFAKKLGWHGNQLHAYEGNGDTTKYTLLGPRFEDSFCGNIAELQHILDFNGLHDVTIFDAKKINLASLPGRPYDLIYSFYSIGFHWSLEHFLNDLMLLLGEAGIAIFTTTANFEPFDSLRQLSYRLVDWKPAWPKDAILKFIVLSKTPLRGDPTPQPSGIRRIPRNLEMAEIFPRSHNAERESGTAAWAQTQNYLGNEMVKIAVVTPYYKENDDVLRQCHLSVVRQSYPCTHILVADGHPKSQFDNEPRTMHITLPQANGDVGNTARAIGGILADAYGFDAVAYLDADNWYDAGHLEGLVAAHEANHKVPLISCKRRFYDLEGRELHITEADEDANQHVDTSCWIVFRPAFSLLRAWLMPKVLAPIGDRIFLQKAAHERFPRFATDNRTVAYRTLFAGHYQAAGVRVPTGAKSTYLSEEIVKYLFSIDGAVELTNCLGFFPRLTVRRKSA